MIVPSICLAGEPQPDMAQSAGDPIAAHIESADDSIAADSEQGDVEPTVDSADSAEEANDTAVEPVQIPDASGEGADSDNGNSSELVESTDQPKQEIPVANGESTPEPAPASTSEPELDPQPEPEPATAPVPVKAQPAVKSSVNTAATKASSDSAATNTVKAQTKPAAKQTVAKPKKAAKKASSKATLLTDNAVYYISSALGKKGAFVVSAADATGAPKTNVVLSTTYRQLSQYWRAIYKGKGIYNLQNYAGGYYLGVAGSASKNVNVHVSRSGIIDWKVVKNPDGTYSLQPASSKNIYLSVADNKAKKGANIRLADSLRGKGQKFTFTKNKRLTSAVALGQPVKPGVVKISVAGTDVRVGIAGNSKAHNAQATTGGEAQSLAQMFQLHYLDNGLYEIRNANSGKMLSVKGFAKKQGAKVVQRAGTKTLDQVWCLKKAGSGYRVISARSGLVLDISGSSAAKGKGMQISKYSGAASQQYTFEEAQLIPNGNYVVQSAMAMPVVLHAKGKLASGATNLQLSRSTGGASDRFNVKYLGNGAYCITNMATKGRVEVANASKKNGANIQLGAANGKANQRWIAEVGDTGIMFKSAATGKYLNVRGIQAKTGANINQSLATGKSNQCWTLANPTWSYYSGVDSKAMKIIRKAESYEGWRYQWGGRSPSTSFDCAGLVMYCSNAAWGTHFDLMNTNAEMLYGMCKHISAAQAKPGDLVFYRGTYGSDVNYISHVVFYTGMGYMYGAGDPIGYKAVNAIKNIKGKKAVAVYARIRS